MANTLSSLDKSTEKQLFSTQQDSVASETKYLKSRSDKSIQTLIIQSLLGDGSYGTVYKSADVYGNKNYAVKVFNNFEEAEIEYVILSYLERLHLQSNLKFHPDIYQASRIINNLNNTGRYKAIDKDCCLSLELFDQHVTLADLTYKRKTLLPYYDICNLGEILFKTVKLMHKHQLAHLDLSCGNIMLPILNTIRPLNLGEIKFIDYGSSFILNSYGERLALNGGQENNTTITVVSPLHPFVFDDNPIPKENRVQLDLTYEEKKCFYFICDLWAVFHNLCYLFSNTHVYLANSIQYRDYSFERPWDNRGHCTSKYLAFMSNLFLKKSEALGVLDLYLSANFNPPYNSFLKEIALQLLVFNCDTYQKVTYSVILESLIHLCIEKNGITFD